MSNEPADTETASTETVVDSEVVVVGGNLGAYALTDEDFALDEPTATAVTGSLPQVGGVISAGDLTTGAVIASNIGDHRIRAYEDIATVGRIVHFTDGRGCLAAMVIAVDDKSPEANVVSVQVFAVGSPAQQFYGCSNEPTPEDPYGFEHYGKWHWPERA